MSKQDAQKLCDDEDQTPPFEMYKRKQASESECQHEKKVSKLED